MIGVFFCNDIIWGKGSMGLSILHFAKGKGESQELGQLGPHMRYRWGRADPRITPGWTAHRNSGSGSGKTGSALF